MKKSVIIGLISLGAVISSRGQGSIFFDNYDSYPYMPIVWGFGNGAITGKGVGDPNVHVDLLYFLGTTSNPHALTDLGLSVPINPYFVDGFGNQGYFLGGIVTIPGYVSGPVTFEVEAWETASPYGGATFASAVETGVSPLWQESSLATGPNAANFFAGLPGPNGSPLITFGILIPEPSVSALASVCAAALFFRPRKKVSWRGRFGCEFRRRLAAGFLRRDSCTNSQAGHLSPQRPFSC